MNELGILGYFLNKHIKVEVEGLIIEGRLTSFQTNSKETHQPSVLVLDGKHILRGDFTSITTLRAN